MRVSRVRRAGRPVLRRSRSRVSRLPAGQESQHALPSPPGRWTHSRRQTPLTAPVIQPAPLSSRRVAQTALAAHVQPLASEARRKRAQAGKPRKRGARANCARRPGETRQDAPGRAISAWPLPLAIPQPRLPPFALKRLVDERRDRRAGLIPLRRELRERPRLQPDGESDVRVLYAGAWRLRGSPTGTAEPRRCASSGCLFLTHAKPPILTLSYAFPRGFSNVRKIVNIISTYQTQVCQKRPIGGPFALRLSVTYEDRRGRKWFR